MLVLDTNHLTELERPRSQKAASLVSLLNAYGQDSATTVITIEEQLAGRIAQIRSRRELHEQLVFYRRLQDHVDFFASWIVLSFDAEAADLVQSFRSQGIRIGSMDLKIAAITIVQDATLLTRNVVDFAKIPGLHFENWLD